MIKSESLSHILVRMRWAQYRDRPARPEHLSRVDRPEIPAPDLSLDSEALCRVFFFDGYLPEDCCLGWGLGFRVQGAGCRVSGCRVQGSGFRVQGFRCMVQW